MTACARAVAERRDGEARELLARSAALMPEHPLVLHERARRQLVAGDLPGARALLERCVAVAPEFLQGWLTFAAALRAAGERDAELGVLDRALALDPTHVVALLQKGAVLELLGRPRHAARVYGNALESLAPGTPLPPQVEAHLEYARRQVDASARDAGRRIDEKLMALRDRYGAEERQRFERCIDRLLGRKRVYEPRPTFMLFPHLANYEFWDRRRFPWLDAVEAATDAIREELLGVLAADDAGVEPYVQYPDSAPLMQWKELNRSRRWGAYFLWREGMRVDDHADRCPRTLEALRDVPRVDIPGRGPTVFFSILEPHTRIPPHHGVTNTRAIVHLPLIVPPGCGFRVGGETRIWEPGRAWVFDDTIEHEAWNDSDAPRAILIFDVWNPELTAAERELVREATVALAGYFEDEGLPGGSL
jgi:aspartyl/asparaginyl beta-hydroxylase (cupin superfamily)